MHLNMYKFILCILFILASLFCNNLTANPIGIIDEFSDATGWEVLPRDTSYGQVEFSNNKIIITRKPTATMSDVAVQKTYRFTFREGTWIHLLIRQPETFLGADMYTTIRLNQIPIIEFNVNGEEHWHNINGRCVAKTQDNSFHIGFAADNREYLLNEKNSLIWTNDVPAAYPLDVKTSYSQWVLYSAKFHVPEDGVPRWRFFVDGSEIIYRDIGYFSPEGQFQNIATVKPVAGVNTITVRLAVLGDGDLYRKEKGYAGASQRACYSEVSPFRIDAESQLAYPKAAQVEWDLLMIGNGRDGDFDNNTIKSFIYAGKIATSAAILTELISWEDAQFNCSYVSHDEIRRVRMRKSQASNFCLARVKSDIYAGYIGTADAILTNLISWQNAQFNCQYMSKEEKKRVRESSKGAAEFCIN